jgi:hypothetical protein
VEIMGCQHEMLGEALAGYIKTGIPLIGYDGNMLKPAGWGDDIGIYYFIPKIAHALGIPLDQSIHLFFISLISISLLMGILGIFLCFKRWIIRCLGVVELMFLAYRFFTQGAIYNIPSSIIIAIIPLFLYFAKGRNLSLSFVIFLSWTGIVIGVGNSLRIHAGIGVLVFMAIILLCYLQISRKQKIVLVILVAVSVLAPRVYFGHVLSQRDVYLTKSNPTYEPVPTHHVVWHSIYIGFGFLDNEYGIRYKDEIAIERVRLISPKTTYLSKKYETMLRKEVFSFIKKHPLFVVRTIFAKFGVICLYLLIFANLGLIAVSLHRKLWQLEIAFWSAIIFYSLFGFLAVPDERYLTGLIAFATLYGIFSINEMVEYITWEQILTLLHWDRGKSRCAG